MTTPEAVTGQRLFNCLEGGLGRLGITAISPDECKFLVGIGTDGASANIASAGMKGLVEKELPWVFWMWCLAHRLELAIKDALKATAFTLIDEMLLQLYYVYDKSPKNVENWRRSLLIFSNAYDLMTEELGQCGQMVPVG